MPLVSGYAEMEILGRLGADPEFSVTKTKQMVARMTVCVNTTWKDKHSGQWKERSEWWHVNAWRQFAEKARRQGHKGGIVLVRGVPSKRKWTTRDGVTQERTEIRATKLVFFHEPRKNQQPQEPDGDAV